MPRRKKEEIDLELLYSKLKYKKIISEKLLSESYPKETEFLKARKLLVSGALAGTLLLAAPQISSLMPPPITPDSLLVQPQADSHKILSQKLASLLPEKIAPLSSDQEIAISHLLYDVFGINAVPELGSTRLNHVYGLIGAEQHLPRFPGDVLSLHDEPKGEGITPGLSGWGYFAPSKKQMTPELVEEEKYYVAVQTLYLPDWQTRTKFLSQWYKHRKIVVINPVNGKAMIAVVADAGPSWWTGKQFGGSPEVMAYLGLNVGQQKGPVILYFVDDSENKVPLGPLEGKT